MQRSMPRNQHSNNPNPSICITEPSGSGRVPTLHSQDDQNTLPAAKASSTQPFNHSKQLSSKVVPLTERDLNFQSLASLKAKPQDLFTYRQVQSLGDYAVHTWFTDERSPDQQLFAIHRSDFSCCPGGRPSPDSTMPFFQGPQRWAPDPNLTKMSSFAEITSVYKALEAKETSMPSCKEPSDDAFCQTIVSRWGEGFLKTLDPTLSDPRIRLGRRVYPFGTTKPGTPWSEGDVPPAAESEYGDMDAWMKDDDPGKWVRAGF